MKLLLHIAYVGTSYCGYQAQKNAPTVQGVLTDSANKLFGFPCDVTGCSRTDSGVHARDFCVTVSAKGTDELITSIPLRQIPLAFATVLPTDISVQSAEWVSSDFHPRYDVKYKEYLYLIWNRPTANPFYADRCWHYPRRIEDEALEQMRRAASYYEGTHDFAAFMATGSKVTETVRSVKYACVDRKEDFLIFRVAADGFLYNMVRIMMGTLIGVAERKCRAEDIPNIILSRDRACAGLTAPAKGLYLNHVEY